MANSGFKSLHGSVSGVALALMCGGAIAQEEPLAEPVRQGGLDSIVVTAQKRETNLQKTAMSVSALSGDNLLDRQITDISGLALAVPNVNFGQTTGNARIAVRGIGFDNISVGNEGRVAYHVDGVYISRPAGALGNMFDIERVEVLRGPQGTLYGRNATAGAVNIITRAPEGPLNGYIRGTAGNYGLVSFEGGVGGSITDTVSGRVSFNVVERNGYGENVTNGNEVDDQSTRNIRAAFHIEPNENLEVIVRGDYMVQDDAAYSFRYLGQGSLPDPDFGYAGVIPLGLQLGGIVPSNPRDSARDFGPENDREFGGASIEANFSLGDVDVTSITAYRRSEWNTITDLDGTSSPLSVYDQFEESDQFSEELRVSHDADWGGWMIGGYYFYEEIFGGTRVPLDRITFPPLMEMTLSGLQQGVSLVGIIDTSAWAVFGNAYVNITDQLTVRLGGRYSSETKDIDEQNSGLLFSTPFPPLPDPFAPGLGTRRQDSTKWTAFTPSVTLEYEATENIFLFAGYSEGFKSGGYNLGNLQPSFDPEEIEQYEIGVRSDWLGGSLRANITGFYYDYTDLQVSKVNGPVITIENAASARLYGADIELFAQLSDQLRVDVTAGLLHTEFKDYSSFDPARPAAIFGEFDLAGNELTQAPSYTVNLGAEYTVPTDIGEFRIRAEGRFVDRVWLTAFNTDHLSQDAYQWFNASLTYDSPNNDWYVSAFVRNIGNEDIVSAALVGSGLVGFPINGSYEPPRTYGVTMERRF